MTPADDAPEILERQPPGLEARGRELDITDDLLAVVLLELGRRHPERVEVAFNGRMILETRRVLLRLRCR